MAKLIDRILSDTARKVGNLDGAIPFGAIPLLSRNEQATRALQPFNATDLPSANVFDVTNVVEPYLQLKEANKEGKIRGWTTQGVKNGRQLSEFAPNLAPPFDNFWMEYRTKGWPFFEVLRREVLNSDEHTTQFSFPRLRDASIGALFRVGSDRDENASALMGTLQKLKAGAPDDYGWAEIQRIDANHFYKTVVPATKWVLQIHLYVETNWDTLTAKPSAVGPIMASTIPIDSEGRPIKSRSGEAVLEESGSKITLPECMLDTDLCVIFMDPLIEAGLHMEACAAFSQCIVEYMGVFQMALSLINCRNIHTVDVVPPPKLAKKHKKKRRTNHDLVVYKVLQIGPTSAPAAENKPTKTGDRLRMHIARGHYKTYTEDKPLFGRYTGTFWWEAQFRGNKKKGLVNKNYRVLGE